jgi:uncharacterized protein
MNYFQESIIKITNCFDIQDYIERLQDILQTNNVSPCHGIEHAVQVMIHADLALKAGCYNISELEHQAVLLAALLHDADDSKFFPTHNSNENLRLVLANKPSEFVELVVKMVNWVSSSKNGDNIPDEVTGKEWLLIPRFADRLEAIGMIGVERCFTSTLKKKGPLFLDSTPRPKTEYELWTVANIERYNRYNGNSVSMMDHFYDKLLRLGVYPIENPYFDKECLKRTRPLINFILKFGSGQMETLEQILGFIKSNS